MINPELFLVTIIIGFFAMMNPVGSLKVFIQLTNGFDKDATKQIALKAVMYTFVIITLVTLFGNYIFQFLFLSIAAFRIAGGVLITTIGFQLLNGKIAKAHAPISIKREKRSANWISLTPTAIPLLAGPGTIILAMNFSGLHQGALHTLVILVGLALNCIFTYFLFTSADKIMARIGEDSINAISRLMGLVITIMGIQMFISGIREVIKLLET